MRNRPDHGDMGCIREPALYGFARLMASGCSKQIALQGAEGSADQFRRTVEAMAASVEADLCQQRGLRTDGGPNCQLRPRSKRRWLEVDAVLSQLQGVQPDKGKLHWANLKPGQPGRPLQRKTFDLAKLRQLSALIKKAADNHASLTLSREIAARLLFALIVPHAIMTTSTPVSHWAGNSGPCSSNQSANSLQHAAMVASGMPEAAM